MAAVTSRYARAFAEVVFDMKLDPAVVLEQLHSIQQMLTASDDLRRVWETPSVPGEQKRKLLDALVARDQILKPVRNFMAVLIDHRRMFQLEIIARQVETELNSRLGLAEADVTSARELAPEERQAVERQVEKITGRKVRAHYATDAKLLGGAVVKVGSTIYDGSVRGQLRRMKEQLAAE